METTKIETKVLHREQIATEFREAMSGKLEPEKIEVACKHLLAGASNHYSANGSVMSMIFYLQFQITISDNNAEPYNHRIFNGKGGGISSPGGGALMGDIYTDDLDRLIKDTHSMEFNCAFAYTSVVFFDKSSHCLGSFQSGSVSTVAGIGGGTGKWK
jgi:hypothetical protein